MKIFLLITTLILSVTSYAEENTQDTFVPTLTTATNTESDQSGDQVNYPPPSDQQATEADIHTDPSNKKRYCKYCQKNKLRLGNDHSSTRVSRQSRQIVTERANSTETENNTNSSDSNSTRTRTGR